MAKKRKRSGGSLATRRLVGLRPGRMHALPLNGCSTRDRRKLLTANPTPCSLGSLGSLPCQKKVQSFFLGLALEATLVSCRATMTILSRNHQLVADHRGGQDTLCLHFSLLGAGWVISPFCLSPVQGYNLLVDFCPSSSKTAFKQADCGGSAPY